MPKKRLTSGISQNRGKINIEKVCEVLVTKVELVKEIIALWNECYSIEQIVEILEGNAILTQEEVESIIEDSTNYD